VVKEGEFVQLCGCYLLLSIYVHIVTIKSVINPTCLESRLGPDNTEHVDSLPKESGWILPAYKPGFVECFHSDGHSSRNAVTCILKQPTRSVLIEVGHLSLPIWPCSRWGLPNRSCCQQRGELLPHRFTLACTPLTGAIGGLLSVALSVNILRCRPGVTWQRALWSPDFPRDFQTSRDHPADSIQLQR
jgi:hypothetical protein